jgi:hypothetical protein
VVAAALPSPFEPGAVKPSPTTDSRWGNVAPEITTVEKHQAYAVKLECVGCPFPVWKNFMMAEWQHPPPNNSLVCLLLRVEIHKLTTHQMLKFELNEDRSSLLLDGKRIFPLDPMPLYINAVQIPTNITIGAMEQQIERGSVSNSPKRMTFPLQYEHTAFRAHKGGFLWVLFNVTGLAIGETVEPVVMGDKVVQILLRQQNQRDEVDGHLEWRTTFSIADIEVVDAKNRVQPHKMECGAIVQTTFDPNNWDEYGQFGTWARTGNVVLATLGKFWVERLAGVFLMLPLALFLAICTVMARRIYQLRQQERLCREDAETALLGRDSDDDDAPPPYADIPVIKIEQYD